MPPEEPALSARAAEAAESLEVSPTSARESRLRPPKSVSTPASEYPELLQAYERLQEESRRRTQALATAAHELKTPLAILAGYLELLLTEKAGPLSDRQRKILEDSQFNCERLQRFIHDFLTYAALETGKLALKPELADLNACLAEVYGFWLPQFQKKGVALYFPANEKVQPFPFEYPKVEQVVSNLLENALKFTPGGGSVWLTAEPYFWERRAREPGEPGRERRQGVANAANAFRVTVADTGPGIAPEYHQEIFDDFFQPPGLPQTGDGMGLGLAIARRLVLAHRGKIWVESEPSAGSRFSFLLPLGPLKAGADAGDDPV